MRHLTNPDSVVEPSADLVRRIIWTFGVVLCLALTLGWARSAAAEVLSSEPSPSTILHVALGKSAPLPVTADVERIVLSQPEIAAIDHVGPRELFVIGREIGATNLLIYGRGSELLQVVNVVVGYDAAQLQDALASVLPNEAITVANLNGGLLMRGSVSTPQAAAVANDLADRATAGDVISILDVQPDQVMLEVQLVEISEDRLRDMGVDLSLEGSGIAIDQGTGLVGLSSPQGLIAGRGRWAGLELEAALSALEQRGDARILARPQILALSGETASFRSGGEFPFPVPTRDGVTIEFKPYGTAISVRPTVQSNGLIRVGLTAEVSRIDTRNSLRVGALTVPGLSTRRASTTLELRDGERFVFAGLFSEAEREQAEQSPWYADIPALGALFKSVSVRRQNLQLAILVTAHVVQGPDAASPAPMDPQDLPADVAGPNADRPAASPPAAPKGLLARIKSSPIARSASHRLTSIAQFASKAPKAIWKVAERFAARLTRPVYVSAV